jgi:hypothetical protein
MNLEKPIFRAQASCAQILNSKNFRVVSGAGRRGAFEGLKSSLSVDGAAATLDHYRERVRSGGACWHPAPTLDQWPCDLPAARLIQAACLIVYSIRRLG